MPYELKDSGERESFETESQRDTQEGKGRFDLISWPIIAEVAVIMEQGSKKYDEHNWRKGQPVMRCFSSAIRHMIKWSLGYTDENHVVLAMVNMMFIAETMRRIERGQLPKSLDDRYPLYTLEDVIK